MANGKQQRSTLPDFAPQLLVVWSVRWCLQSLRTSRSRTVDHTLKALSQPAFSLKAGQFYTFLVLRAAVKLSSLRAVKVLMLQQCDHPIQSLRCCFLRMCSTRARFVSCVWLDKLLSQFCSRLAIVTQRRRLHRVFAATIGWANGQHKRCSLKTANSAAQLGTLCKCALSLCNRYSADQMNVGVLLCAVKPSLSKSKLSMLGWQSVLLACIQRV